LTFYKVVAKVMERVSPSHRDVHNYYQPADIVFEDAKSFISANTDSRWLLYTHLMEPHDPYFEHPNINGSGSEEYNGIAYGRAEHERPDVKDTEYLKDVYKQEIEFMDLEIGRMIDWLKQNDQYDNTAIVVISDHGEEFNEHGGFWHGTTLYDEVLHVPLIIKTPTNGPKGKRIPWQVRSIDVAPTITSLLGLEADSSWEGENLVVSTVAPPSEDQCAPHPLDRLAISENDFEGNILSSIRMNNFKYILANKDNPRGLPLEEMFRLLNDPIEKDNLALQEGEHCQQKHDARKLHLKAILGEVLKEAQQSAVRSDGVELDEATIERMRALGYME
jgi:arylsulfatase A-like enzyme